MNAESRPLILFVGGLEFVPDAFLGLANERYDVIAVDSRDEGVSVSSAENHRLVGIVSATLMPHPRGDLLVEWFVAVNPDIPVIVVTPRPEYLTLDQLLGFDALGVTVVPSDLDPALFIEGVERITQNRLAELAGENSRINGEVMTKILVVDDSPIELQLVTNILTSRGYQVVTATDGDEVLPKAVQEKPRLIILDVVMARQTGYEACRTIKETDATKDIKVIMLTSKSQRSDRFWGISQGADDYLTKPFQEKDLLDAVARQL